MMLPSRLDCPLSLKTPNMGNPGYRGRLKQFERDVLPRLSTGASLFGTISPLRLARIARTMPRKRLSAFDASRLEPPT